jgi:alpha 1,3-glucosidase
MTAHNIPCDSIWLDIEYTEHKKYFTWDHNTFPKAKEMLAELIKEGRKLVTIIDPHIKKDEEYFLYKELLDKKLYVMDHTGESPYVGWCWPGTSVWLDFMNPQARAYLSSLYVKRPACIEST